MRKINPKDYPKIVRLYADLSAKQIGERYGVTHQAILDIVRKSGGKIRPHGTNATGNRK